MFVSLKYCILRVLIFANWLLIIFARVLIFANGQLELIGTKKWASKIDLQITNASQGKCQGWIEQSFEQKIGSIRETMIYNILCYQE